MPNYFPEPAVTMKDRFRGYLPVVIDVETAGFDCQKNALLEIGLCFLEFDESGMLKVSEQMEFRVKPFEGAEINLESCAFIQIDPFDPNRQAEEEKDVVKTMCKAVSFQVKKYNCKRAIIVAHNAHFDQGFILKAIERCRYKRSPFHPFSCVDTAGLSALLYGQTVLSVACEKAGIAYDNEKAHGALYDASVTAELFCTMVNRFHDLMQLTITASDNQNCNNTESQDKETT